MKQTAVEWLIEQLFELRNPKLNQIEILKQAKEMEKQQQGYSEEYMKQFAWFLIENVGQYSCDKTAHFEGKYLEQFKKK